MINYLMLGTNDLEVSTKFYDALLITIGGNRAFNTDRMVVWSFGNDTTMLAVTLPYDEQPATVGNGTMVALSVETQAQVDEMHAKAMELGGADEGTPGPRGKNFYGGYFRDPDGNKLNFFCSS